MPRGLPLPAAAAALAVPLAGAAPAGGNRTIRGAWLEVTVGGGVFRVTDPHGAAPGARGDGATDDTESIQAAFDAAAAAGGGTVLFPAGGTYSTLPFHFSGSHSALELPLGARVVFSNDKSKYANSSDILNLIEANKLSNLAIIGDGVFDGQGKPWWPCAKIDKVNCFRPKMLKMHRCDNVLLQGVTFKDSPSHVLEMGSDFTELDHVTVLAPPGGKSNASTNGTTGPSHNTDAVDVHGTPFYVHHSHFDTGDDNVAVHASNVLVEHSYFGHGHGASIGSCGSDVQLQNITFRNIIFNRTGTAMRIKTDAGAARSYVRDATWENLVLHDVDATLTLTMFYHSEKNETTDFDISNVTVRNVTAYGSYNPDTNNKVTPGILHCQESSPCHGIHLEDIVHVDVSAPFDCYNAYGTWRNVTPEPCLRSEGPLPPSPPSPAPPADECDVGGCLSRCVAEYGTIKKGAPAFYCAKGCAKMNTDGTVKDKMYCDDPSGNKRYAHCADVCSGKDDKDRVQECLYGCGFWKP